MDVYVSDTLKRTFFCALTQGRVIVFHAPCGYGKSSLARVLLQGKNVFFISARNTDTIVRVDNEPWDVLCIDDMQCMLDSGLITMIYQKILQFPDRRFVFLTRGTVPAWLLEFRYAGLLLSVDRCTLAFQREDLQKYYSDSGIRLTSSEIAAVHRKFSGYPLACRILRDRLCDGACLDQSLFYQVEQAVYTYLEGAVLFRFVPEQQRALAALSMFPEFDTELACIVTRQSNAEAMLHRMLQNTSMLEEIRPGYFCFISRFQTCLKQRIANYLDTEEQRDICHRAACYFVKKGQLDRAMECYASCNDHEQIAILLEQDTTLFPDMYAYQERIRFLHQIPETRILRSPILMQRICLDLAISGQYAESEQWYARLKEMAQQSCSDTAQNVDIVGRLLWLDIVLPQRALETLPALCIQAAALNRTHGIRLCPLPITCSLPSVINGGKDLLPLIIQSDNLFDQLREPLSSIMQKESLYYLECAHAEAMFLRGENVGPQMLSLVSCMHTVQQIDSPDLEFVIVGVLARNQLDMGQPSDARRTVENLKDRFLRIGADRFLQNIDAFLCRISIYQNDLDSVGDWYREKAPMDCITIRIQDRFQYLTQAMAEITLSRYTPALVTLASLEIPFENTNCIADRIHLNLLRAIALFRMENETWKEPFYMALNTATRYSLIRPISMYGGAVLPLLSSISNSELTPFLAKVVRTTRMQSAHYPMFMQMYSSPSEALTDAEYHVLKLICANKSNQDICDTLGIKLPTAKTHVSRILNKLGVKRRNEVRQAAENHFLL